MLHSKQHFLVWGLALVMAVSPSAVHAQKPAAKSKPAATKPAAAKPTAKPVAEKADPTGATSQAQESPLDLTFLTEDTFAAVVVHPRRILLSSSMELFPHEIVTAASIREGGIDAMTIERILLFIETPSNDGSPPSGALRIDFSAEYDQAALLEKIPLPFEEVEVAGQKCYRLGTPIPMILSMPDAKSLLVGTPEVIERAAGDAKMPTENAVVRLLAAQGATNDATAFIALKAIRPIIEAQLQQAPPVPPPFEKFKQIPLLIDTAALRVNVSGSGPSGLALLTQDETKAKELQELLDSGITIGKQMILAEATKDAARDPDDTVKQAAVKWAERTFGRVAEMLRPQQQANRVTFEIQGSGQMNVATIGILVSLLLPAIQAARAAARRNQSLNNLKQLSLAMHMHENAKKELPARANVDTEGKPLLSWRVHLLPYIDQQGLYEQFHLDEPWDSEHNQKLIDKMPAIFASPSGQPAPMTHYVVPVGEGTAFENYEPSKFAAVSDGLTKTIMILESDQPVVWTQPDDFEIDMEDPLANLGGLHPGRNLLTAFMDGHVEAFNVDALDDEEFQAMLTIAGED
jgi:hypothetical protein